jgi:filamentous hemagglutinin
MGAIPLAACSRESQHKALNEVGQTIVDDILTAPGAETSIVKTRRYGTVIEVRAPDGRGLRYDEYGNLVGFLEP